MTGLGKTLAGVGALLKRRKIRAIPISCRNDLFRKLKINRFTDVEIRASFDRFKPSPDASHASPAMVREYIHKYNTAHKADPQDGHVSIDLVDSSIERLLYSEYQTEDQPGDDKGEVEAAYEAESEEESSGVTLPEYKSRVMELADRLDPRIWPIAASFFLTGASLGVVVPCMPLLVSELSITPSQFGFVISSFALAKLFSNIPSTHYVDIVGRKPLMVAGLGMCAVGLSGIGLSLYPGFGYPTIIACRIISGIGVSAFVSGSFMYLCDISTFRNRARTNAPTQAGFNGGLAIGPAMGGVLIEYAGISHAYFAVGTLFAGLAILNQILLRETASAADLKVLRGGKSEARLADSFSVAFNSWRALYLAVPEVKNVLVLNTAYWYTLSGAQFTLLPLLMVSPRLNLSVSQIATCFGLLSITSFLLSQPLAFLSDKYDKIYVSCTGSLLLATSCLLMPMTSSFYELLAAVVPLAIGTTIFSTAPPSHMANIAPEQDRSQALSLLRTVGDVGFLVGASAAGILAGACSVESTMLMNGAMLVVSAAAVAARHARYAAAAAEQGDQHTTPPTPRP